MKILITGGQGYIGRNLTRLFKDNTSTDVFSPTKSYLDVLDFDKVKSYITATSPDVIIHCAIRGGKSNQHDSVKDIADNIAMFDNIRRSTSNKTIVFILGSGAEFDRRFSIDCANEEDVNTKYPIDPYGLSKNIITRQALSYPNTYILRLFGCFNYDEEPFRFIKRSILNMINGASIEIRDNKYMDFFFMDDVYTVINSLIQHGGMSHINLTYPNKYSLLTIADMIVRISGRKTYPISVLSSGGISYTGDYTKLKSMGLDLIGLEEGIRRTYKALI